MTMTTLQQVSAVVVKALHDTQLETVDKIREFLSTNDEVDQEFIGSLLDQYKAKLVAEFKPPKGLKMPKAAQPKQKRAPSAYTLFIKDKMNEIKTSNPNVKNGQELMKLAVEEWSKISADVKEKMKVLNKEDATLTGTELFTKASAGTQASAVQPAKKKK